MKNIILLLSGKNGAGKTTMSNYIVKNYSFINASFVYGLKQSFIDVYNISMKDLTEYKNLFRYQWTLNQVKEKNIDVYNKIKEITDYSQSDDEKHDGLVELSRFFLNMFGEDYWVKDLITRYYSLLFNSNVNLVIDDWRKLIEYYKIRNECRQRQIICVRIKEDRKRLINSGYTFVDNEMESQLDDFKFDYFIDNTKDLIYFYKQIDNLMINLSVNKDRNTYG